MRTELISRRGRGTTLNPSFPAEQRGLTPAFYANFLMGTTLPSWITFSRAGNAMVFDSTGKLTYAPNNLLTYSNDVSQAAWSADSNAKSQTTGTLPDGSTGTINIFSSTFGGTWYPRNTSWSLVAGQSYILSVWVRTNGNDPTSSKLSYYDGAWHTGQALTLTTSWQRVFLAFTAAASASVGVGFQLISPASAGYGIQWVWSQLEAVTYQTTPSTYNPTTTAAYYGPRFDYDPVTLAPRGLLIEESRTNLALYSSGNGAAWGTSGTGASLSTNSVISPDGTQDAQTFTQGTVLAHSYRQLITVTPSTAYTMSFWAKVGTATDVSYSVYDNTNAANIVAATSYFSSVNSTSWTRIKVSFTTPAACTAIYVYFDRDSNSAGTMYFYGMQVEPGSFATSYIPTTTAAVTRAADVAQITGGALSVLQGAAWSAIVEANSFALPTASPVILGSTVGSLALIYFPTTNTISSFDGSASPTTISATAGAGVWGTNAMRAALASSANSRALSLSGGTVASTGSPFVGARTAVQLGAYVGGSQPADGYIRSLALYSKRLPDAVLQAKSTVGAPY